MTVTALPVTHASIVRMASAAGLLLVATAVLLNVLIPSPSPDLDAPVGEIVAYVQAHDGTLAVTNALRWAVFILLPFFAVGVYRFVSGLEEGPQRSWALVGLLAAVWIPASGTVANSIEIAGVWKVDEAGQQTQMAMTLWAVSSVLFVTAQAAWGTLVLAFSVAGRLGGVMPAWLTGLGAVTFASCMAATLGVLSVLNGGWVEIPAFASYVLFPFWVAVSSILMLRRSWVS
jgi:hypothetical protein